MRLVFISLFIFVNCENVLAQKAKRIMVFANKNDFLIPLIKTNLEELINTKSGEKLFSKTINFNLQPEVKVFDCDQYF